MPSNRSQVLARNRIFDAVNHSVSHSPSVIFEASTYVPSFAAFSRSVSLSSACFRVPRNVCHFCLRRGLPVSGCGS